MSFYTDLIIPPVRSIAICINSMIVVFDDRRLRCLRFKPTHLHVGAMSATGLVPGVGYRGDGHPVDMADSLRASAFSTTHTATQSNDQPPTLTLTLVISPTTPLVCGSGLEEPLQFGRESWYTNEPSSGSAIASDHSSTGVNSPPSRVGTGRPQAAAERKPKQMERCSTGTRVASTHVL